MTPLGKGESRTNRESWQAMVLAAGEGRRLAPMTEMWPKPLLPWGAHTLLHGIVEGVFASGIPRVGINAYHRHEQIRQFVEEHPRGKDMTLFVEPRLLGTGGALDNARFFLRRRPRFLLHNGDVLARFDLNALLDQHERSGRLATLMLMPDGPENRVWVDECHCIRDINDQLGLASSSGWRKMTYAGVAAFETRFLDYVDSGASNVVDAWLRALQSEPGCLGCWVPEKGYWNDLGTPERLFRSLNDALQNRVSGMLGASMRPEPLAVQGSDRRFFRIGTFPHSLVLMDAGTPDFEFQAFLDLANHLPRRAPAPPKIYAVDGQNGRVLMEDLGDETLWQRVTRDPSAVIDSYQRVLESLAALQEIEIDALPIPAICDRQMDRALLRWESDYFRDRFLVAVVGFSTTELEVLEPEFERLARLVATQPRVFMHRDFQSQNVMFKDNQVRMVDFQGARPGPLLYDLAALLNDPYVPLSKSVRLQLLGRFHNRVKCRWPDLEAYDRFVLEFHCASLQRLMQALGAFGFLSRVKGKVRYEAFINPGLERLADHLQDLECGAFGNGRFPALRRVVFRAVDILKERQREADA